MNEFFFNLGISIAIAVVMFIVFSIGAYISHRKEKKIDPDAKYTEKDYRQLILVFCGLIVIGIFVAINMTIFGTED